MAATSTLPAIVQRLHRLSDSRAPQLTQTANTDKSQTAVAVEETDLVRRRRNASKPNAPKNAAVPDAQSVSGKPVGPSRVVYFTCNNDPLGRKAKFVRITPNRYLSWNDLLNDLTAKLKHDGFYLPHGVRQIYTPTHGRRVATLDELQDGETYVCAGVEPFKANQNQNQNQNQSQTTQLAPALNHAPKSVVMPVLNTLSLTASDSGVGVNLAQPSRYQRIGAAPRPLNASVPVPRKGDHFQRLYKRYQRLPAIKEQREVEKEFEDTKPTRPAPLDTSVSVFLRDEMRKQAGEYAEFPSITKSHRAAAVYHQRKREFVNVYQAKDEDADLTQQPNDSRKPPLLTTEPNRLINIVYYERVSSNCKVIKILLNSPRMPPTSLDAGTTEDAADAYSRYQRLYSLKRIRKILNKTFSKDETIKQKISRDAFLHLVTPSGREVTNTPDLLQILDTDMAEGSDRLSKKTSVGATISDNNYMFIAMHDSPSHSSLALADTTASETLLTVDDRQLGADTTLSNNDLELILQELIAKNANKRLIHKLYQVLHYKETEVTDPFKPVPQAEKEKLTMPDVEPQESTAQQSRSPVGHHLAELAAMSSKKTKSTQDADESTVSPPAPTQSEQPERQLSEISLKTQTNEKRVKFAERSAVDEDSSSLSAGSESNGNSGAKQNRARTRKRQVKKATSLPRFNQGEKESEEYKVRRQSDTRAPVQRRSKAGEITNEVQKAGEPDDALESASEAEKRMLETERKRRNQQITLVRRTLPPPATAAPSSSTQTTNDASVNTPTPVKNAPSSSGTPDAGDVVLKEDIAVTLPPPERRPISGPVKSMLSIDTPRDTQIDLNALKNVQNDQQSPQQDSANDTEDDREDEDTSQQTSTTASPNIVQPPVNKQPDKQTKARETPAPSTARELQQNANDQRLVVPPTTQPVVNVTPREVRQPAPAPAPVPVPPQPPAPAPTQPSKDKDEKSSREEKRLTKPIAAAASSVPIGKSRYSFTKFIRGMEVLQERYDFGRQLGDGNFAIVREGRSKVSGKEYAVKIIDKSKLRNKEYMLENEIRVLKTCSHANIIELRDQYESEPNVFLIMELARGGDLFDYITSHVKFPEAQAFEIISDMAEAIFYLHSRNIVHRDLKPENLLICDGRDGRKITKLGDFGLSMEVKKPIYTVCGTPTYVAPEILMERGYGLEVDMWALGVILYILLCGFPPFRSPDRRQSELFRMIKKGDFEFISPYWDHISSSAKDLVRHLLVVEPSKRFKAIDVLTHPWILTRGNVKRMDRSALGELQGKKREELEQKAAILLKDYRDTLHHLEQQYGQQPIVSFRPPA